MLAALVLLVAGPGVVAYIYGYYTADIGQMKAYEYIWSEKSSWDISQYGNPTNVSCNEDLTRMGNIRFSRKDNYQWRKHDPIKYRKVGGKVELVDDPCVYETDKRVGAGHKAAFSAYSYLMALVPGRSDGTEQRRASKAG
jgi:hypothetical protein